VTQRASRAIRDFTEATMNWDRLSIDAAGLDCESLLAAWRWLVPAELRPFSLSVFGDWFFEGDQGEVVFLDTVVGELVIIADSREEFLQAREVPENRDEWYLAELAAACWESGLQPQPGQCLSFKIPPVLSGPIDIDNVEVSDLLVHESLLGQIHEGVRDLPEGTVIDRFVEGDE
jgi:hypothetical protein